MVANPRLVRAESPEPHGLAFMIGRVRDIVTARHHPGRWLVAFSEYADIEVPDVWEALGGGQKQTRRW